LLNLGQTIDGKGLAVHANRNVTDGADNRLTAPTLTLWF
jgi:hypothetical protein